MTPASLEAVAIPCADATLAGILHRPATASDSVVVFVAGAPQYRVGSHRLFFQLADHLARHGVTTLRADYRGSGDSPGAPRRFDAIRGDIGAQLAWLRATLPAIRRVYLLGLCDGASAALLATTEHHADGLILVNPWSEASGTAAAQTLVRHYYRQRLLSKAFWAKLARGEVPLVTALRGFFAALQDSRAADNHSRHLPDALGTADRQAMVALDQFDGAVLSIHGGADLAGQRFLALLAQCHAYLDSSGGQITKEIIADADHTFSRLAWREALQNATLAFLERKQ